MTLRRIRAGEVIICLVLLISASTNAFWGYKLFHDSDLFAGMACLIPLAMLAVSFFMHSDRINANQLLIALAVYAVILITSGFSPKQILFYGLCVGLLMYSPAGEYKHMLKLFLILGILYALGSILYLVFPGFYKSFILPAFSGSSQYSRLVRWSRRTSNFIVPSFANQTPYAACFFIYGIGYLFCTRTRETKHWVPACGLILLFTACLVLTNKRGHFLFAALALVGTFYLSATKEQRGIRALRIALIGITAAVVLYIVINNVDIGVFRKIRRMFENLSNDEDISSGRGDLALTAFRQFLKHPLFGIGWEKFRFLPELESSIQTHNIYMQLLCETGIVGISVMGIFFAYSFRAAVRSCRFFRQGTESAAAKFCLFIQAFFLLYGLTGNPLYDPPYYIPYFLACAFSFALYNRTYDDPAGETEETGVEAAPDCEAAR